MNGLRKKDLKIGDKMEEIIKIITNMSGKYSTTLIFDDFVKMVAISLSNSTDILHDKVWKKRENQYKTIISKYTKEEIEDFVKILAILVNLFEEKIHDYLGYIYMKCEMGNSRTGQFFTPFNLSELTAQLSIDNIETIKQTNDIITLNEPACGGGGLILAYLKILKDNNINYQKRVKIVAQDLDFRSVYMTYIQLSLIGARAKIVQGDTLIETNVKDKERVFYTPMWKGLL